jgi:iron complex outermembrane receptor protein
MSGIRSAVAASVSLILGTSFAAAETSAEPAAVNVSIEAKALMDALNDWAQQTGYQLIVRAEDARANVISRPVTGTLPADRALEILLTGSGLGFDFVDERTVAIFNKRTNQPISAAKKASRNEESAPVTRTAMLREGGASDTQSGIASGSSETGDKSTGPATVQLEEVVVTGTHIRGVTATASPVMVFDRKHIERTGFSTIEQFIESLPQNFGGGVSQDTGYNSPSDLSLSNQSVGASVTLRGLGVGTTLVLLNGHRMAPAGTRGAFTDISMIPLHAIERVEVLTDGASAIYGSDAIGGVINFVLRKDFTGLDTRVRYGADSAGKTGEWLVSQGGGLSWSGGGALLSYEFYERDKLRASERDFTGIQPGATGTLLPDQQRHSGFLSIHHAPNDRVSLFLDALVSQREFATEQFSPTLPFMGTTVGEVAQYMLASGTKVALSRTWDLEVSGSWSSSRENSASDLYFFGDPNGITHGDVKAEMGSIDALLNGALFAVPGGDVKLAVGGSYREQQFGYTYLLPGAPTPYLDSDTTRRTSSAFGELHLPIIGRANALRFARALELSIAGRYDDYDDFGAAFVPKFGLRYEPAAGLSLRATYGKSYRAPLAGDLVEQNAGHQISNMGPDDDPYWLLIRQGSGNPALKEEQSEAWTVGFDYEPATVPIKFSATYYGIDYSGKISLPSVSLADYVLYPDVFAAVIVRNPGAAFVNERLAAIPITFNPYGPIDPDDIDMYVDGRYINLAAEKQHGFDFSIQSDFDTALGRVALGLNASKITKFERAISPTAPWVSVVDVIYAPVDFRARAQGTLIRGNTSVTVAANYLDDYVNNTVVPNVGINSWTTVDLSIRYEGWNESRNSLLRGVSVALNVQNLFDSDPPRITATPQGVDNWGYDAANADPLGRFISLEIAKRW